ncbi:hypothetical protein Tco_1239352 [Tanacetum coccineum]
MDIVDVPQADTDLMLTKKDWFNDSPKPEVLDPDWNTIKTIDDTPEQLWFNEIIQAEKPLLTFDDLMSNPINFLSYAMNRLKLNEITQEVLVGPVYNLLKGLRKKYHLSLKNDMPPQDKMDNPNITMEEYIRLEEEKACRRGKVYNWETAKYGKIWYDEDVHDLRSGEIEFPAIVFNDEVLFDESDDEDYTPKVSCFDDLDLFKDFENEFPAIVYNVALASKSEHFTKPTLCPQHIDEFDLKNETSLSEYDEVEQNILYLNDLFLFNIIYLDDLKSGKDNDDDKFDIIQSSEDNVNTQGSNKIMEASHDKNSKLFIMEDFIMELNVNIVAWNYLVNGMLFNHIKYLFVWFGILFDPKRYYKDGVYTRMLWRPRYVFFTLFKLGYMVSKNGYGVLDIAYFETRLGKIYRREVHRIQVFDFGGLTKLMDKGLRGRILMEHRDAQGQNSERVESGRQIFDKGDLSAYWREISSKWLIACSITGRSQAPEKVIVTDLFYLSGMDIGSVNIPYLLARYLRLFASGRKQGAIRSGGQFVALLVEHFGLLTEERLQGFTVIVRDLPMINMAPGPERQQVAMASAPKAAEDAPVADKGASAVLAPVQVPQPPPPVVGPAQTMAQRLARVEEDMHEIQGAPSEHREILDSMAHDFSRFSTWTVVGLSHMMSQARVRYTSYADFQIPYVRHTRCRTDDASNSTTH